MSDQVQTVKPDRLNAIAYTVAFMDRDFDRAARIYEETNPVALMAGMSALVVATGMHACRNDEAALRRLLLTVAHEVELTDPPTSKEAATP